MFYALPLFPSSNFCLCICHSPWGYHKDFSVNEGQNSLIKWFILSLSWQCLALTNTKFHFFLRPYMLLLSCISPYIQAKLCKIQQLCPVSIHSYLLTFLSVLKSLIPLAFRLCLLVSLFLWLQSSSSFSYQSTPANNGFPNFVGFYSAIRELWVSQDLVGPHSSLKKWILCNKWLIGESFKFVE